MNRWRSAWAACAALAALHATAAGPATYYISPRGSDAATGAAAATPFKTFRRAFERMAGGDELVLLDGTYSDEAGTGHVTFAGEGGGGFNSAQAPSGYADRPTRVRAQNPGKVKVIGRLMVGRSHRKDRYIVFEGITFVGGGWLFNTSHVTVRNCGFNGFFGIGTKNHEMGNDHNLVEDVWVWARGERGIAMNYRANRNVWRRVLVRGDGCGKPECTGFGSNNPNIGTTVYESSEVSFQNVMVVDRILAPGDTPFADFAVAQHIPGQFLFGRNEWLGTISLKAPDSAYFFAPDRDGTIDPTIRISNAVAWDPAAVGFNFARAGTNIRAENLTARAPRSDGIRVAPELTSGQILNGISLDAGRYGVNSAFPSAHMNVFGAKTAYNQKRCTEACLSSDPRADGPTPSLRYIVRIEEGSLLKGKGRAGADIGANVLYRYGRDGSRYGEPGFNDLTDVPLWPWPNEARIRKEMCADSGVTRGFCAAPSITRYVWEYLGHPMPDDPYKGEGSGRRGSLGIDSRRDGIAEVLPDVRRQGHVVDPVEALAG